MSKGAICQLLLGFCFGEVTETPSNTPTKHRANSPQGVRLQKELAQLQEKNMRKVASDLFIFLINLERLEARGEAGLAVCSS